MTLEQMDNYKASSDDRLTCLVGEIHRLRDIIDERVWNGEPVGSLQHYYESLRSEQAKGHLYLPRF